MTNKNKIQANQKRKPRTKANPTRKPETRLPIKKKTLENQDMSRVRNARNPLAEVGQDLQKKSKIQLVHKLQVA